MCHSCPGLLWEVMDVIRKVNPVKERGVIGPSGTKSQALGAGAKRIEPSCAQAVLGFLPGSPFCDCLLVSRSRQFVNGAERATPMYHICPHSPHHHELKSVGVLRRHKDCV